MLFCQMSGTQVPSRFPRIATSPPPTATMCYQVVEVYAKCRCLYYQHAIDRCPRYETRGHGITQRTLYVGYTCVVHTEDPSGYRTYFSRKSKRKVNNTQPQQCTSSDYASREEDSTATGSISTAQSPKHGDHKGKSAERGDIAEPETAQLRMAAEEVLLSDVDLFGLEPDLETDGSVISETCSEVSVASSTTTVDGDALGAIFHRLMVFESLPYLWPQLVAQCGSRMKSLRTIERLLRRWSDDLGILATSSDLRSSESMICLSACRFLRKSRLSITHRLWEAHHLLEVVDVDSDSQIEPGVEQLIEDKYVEDRYEPGDDDNFEYAVAESFLFDTEPILALQASVKELVTSYNHQKENTMARLYRSMDVYFSNFMTTVFESPAPPRSKRLWWKCRCGQKIYDDYTELQPGAVERLERLLKDHTQTPGGVGFNTSSTTAGSKNALAGLATRCKDIFTTGKKSHLPSHQSSRQPVETLGLCPRTQQAPQVGHYFALLCVPFMERAVKLHQPEVCRINSDREFFRLLRYYYASQRGVRSWARLRKVQFINFVKFEVYKSQLVDIQTCPSIPPETGKHDYTYDPIPAECNPPIGPNIMMHLFEHPDHAECEPVLYKKVPKKLREKVEACPVKKSAVGWGVHFVEGVNWFALFICGCSGFATALILAVVWSIVQRDIQGAFAMAGFVLAFLGFCMGIARIEIEIA